MRPSGGRSGSINGGESTEARRENPQGVYRDISNIKVRERGATGWVKRRKKRAEGTNRDLGSRLKETIQSAGMVSGGRRE